MRRATNAQKLLAGLIAALALIALVAHSVYPLPAIAECVLVLLVISVKPLRSL
jgi:hypothetical protein